MNAVLWIPPPVTPDDMPTAVEFKTEAMAGFVHQIKNQKFPRDTQWVSEKRIVPFVVSCRWNIASQSEGQCSV